MPEKTTLRSLNAEHAASLHCPFDQLGCRVIQLVAWQTLIRSLSKRKGNPFGCLSDRSGRGASVSPCCFLLRGIERALLAVPQGGARKIPTTYGLDSHCVNNSTPAAVVRFARRIYDIACLCLCDLCQMRKPFQSFSMPQSLAQFQRRSPQPCTDQEPHQLCKDR